MFFYLDNYLLTFPYTPSVSGKTNEYWLQQHQMLSKITIEIMAAKYASLLS